MPQNLSSALRSESAFSLLQGELLLEQAATLGRLGRALEAALAALVAADADAADREALIGSAADAAWKFFVQRETLGLWDHYAVIAHYAIPQAVLAGLGAQSSPTPE